jgi:hypothetical protein
LLRPLSWQRERRRVRDGLPSSWHAVGTRDVALDLDGAKAMFNKIKGEYGPIAKDQDLLGHLDPMKSFEFKVGGQG